VCNVLGNESTSLAKDLKFAGSYEVEFDVTSLSCGIYFYQLRADSLLRLKRWC